MMQQPMLFVELQHLAFSDWFVKLFRSGELGDGLWSIPMLQQEYLSTCYQEEVKWRRWLDAVEEVK